MEEHTPSDSDISDKLLNNNNANNEVFRCPLSVEASSEVQSTLLGSSPCINNDVAEQKEELMKFLEKRMQPILELVESERTYVQGLKLVIDSYMSLLQEPLPSLDIPSTLTNKWRILWGNWLQLYEWHRTFLERLERCLNEDDVDAMPKLLIDSQTRLRTIYSKYCENHRKAALIAEQNRDFFEEVRQRVGDKQDLVSHLMKPVQRIMRYQLPMELIVKYTEMAALPALPLWRRALSIMKEIPGDTQLILEAARIDGYPGVITALGKLRLRDDLLVATLSTAELRLLRGNSNNIAAPGDSNSTGVTAPVSSSSSSVTSPLHLQDVPHFSAFLTPSNSISPPPPQDIHTSTSNPSMATFKGSGGETSIETAPHSTSDEPNNSPVTPSGRLETSVPVDEGMLKFQERRVFLFDQSVLFTEEVKPKKSNPFAQSSFQFRGHVNINKMKFESHWPRGRSTSAGSANSSNQPTTSTTSQKQPISGVVDEDTSTASTNNEHIRFAIHEITRGKECVYVIDPLTVVRHEAWVHQLRELQNQQMELLLALQDPMRFSATSASTSSERSVGGPPRLPLGGDVFYASNSFDSPTHISEKQSAAVAANYKSFDGDARGGDGRLRLPTFNRRSHPVGRDTPKSMASDWTRDSVSDSTGRRNSDCVDNDPTTGSSPTDAALLHSDDEDPAVGGPPTGSVETRRKVLPKSGSVAGHTTNTAGDRYNSSQSYHESVSGSSSSASGVTSRSSKNKKGNIFSNLFGKSSSHKHKLRASQQFSTTE